MSEVIIAIIMSYLNGCDILRLIRSNIYYQEVFKKYSKLIHVDFSYSVVEDEDLKYYEGVYSIDLTGCQKISHHGIKYIQNAHIINISWSRILLLYTLPYLQKVHTLDISGCRYISFWQESFGFLKNVNTLNLSNISITNKGLKYLEKVEHLNLSGCRNISDEGIKNFKNLKTINLYGCTDITNKVLKYLEDVKIIDYNWSGINLVN
jgi:hypothetical protein